MGEHTNQIQPVGSMRVFISWSGERSKVLAQALKEWLPLVLHNVEPWMSEVDIAAGGNLYEPLACGPYVEAAYRAAWPRAESSSSRQ